MTAGDAFPMLAASMRRLLWLILLVAAAPRAFSAQTGDLAADALQRDIALVSALYPRLEGSEGEKALLALIAERLESLGLRGETLRLPRLGHGPFLLLVPARRPARCPG